MLAGRVGEKFDSAISTAAELNPNPTIVAPFVMVNEASIVPLVCRVKVTDPWLTTGFPFTSMVKSPVTESAKAPTLSRQRHNTKNIARRWCMKSALLSSRLEYYSRLTHVRGQTNSNRFFHLRSAKRAGLQNLAHGFDKEGEFMDVLQLSGRRAGDVKELRNDSPTRDLQMAADRTRPHTLCCPVVSSLFSFAARC